MEGAGGSGQRLTDGAGDEDEATSGQKGIRWASDR